MRNKLPKQKETTPKALSRESFEKIRDLVIPEKRRSHTLTGDLYLFACYTGTAYADVVRITKENLYLDEEGRDGKIQFERIADYGRYKRANELSCKSSQLWDFTAFGGTFH